MVLDDEVEERVRGWKTLFWDKRAVEHGLMVDSLDLPGNEPVGILPGGGGGGGAGSQSLCRDRLLWNH